MYDQGWDDEEEEVPNEFGGGYNLIPDPDEFEDAEWLLAWAGCVAGWVPAQDSESRR